MLGGLWSLHHLQLATEIEGLHTWPSDSLTLLAKMMGSRTCTCPKLGQSQALWEVEYMDPFSLSIYITSWMDYSGELPVFISPYFYSWMQQAAYTVKLTTEGDRRGKGGEN